MPDSAPPPRNPLLTLAAVAVVILGLRELRAPLLPVCFGLFLAVLGSVPRAWLVRHRVPPRIAAALVLGLMLAAALVLFRALERTLATFAAAVPAYRARGEALLADTVAALATLGIDAEPRQLMASLEPRTWIGFAGDSLGGALGLGSAALLAGFVLFFAMFEVDRLRGRLRTRFGAAYDEGRLVALVASLQRYLAVKTVTSFLTGACAFTACAAFGVAFSGLWGLVAFVLNFVPIVGSILAAVPPALLALVEPELGMRVALPLLLVYVVINNGISNLLEPLFMGHGVGISPLAVLLSVVFWGWLWGPGGMFLAVPLTLALDTLIEHNPDLRFLGALIGRRAPG